VTEHRHSDPEIECVVDHLVLVGASAADGARCFS